MLCVRVAVCACIDNSLFPVFSMSVGCVHVCEFIFFLFASGLESCSLAISPVQFSQTHKLNDLK